MSIGGIRALADIAGKPERLILGLMSGTSLDGLDLALCRIRGAGLETGLRVERFVTVPYSDAFRRKVLECFARPTVPLQALTLLHAEIGLHHAAIINRVLRDWNIAAIEVDLVASHGQTIYHAPKSLHGDEDRPNATLQLGDGDHIARVTGIVTCSDFRQKHIAAGGEGAPLAAYGDFLLFSDPSVSRVLLNIGGIANITYLPARQSGEAAFCSDIGPGNTLMDAYMREHRPPATFDRDAALAANGKVHTDLLDRLLQDPFFRLPLPKTTGPEHFSLGRFSAMLRDTAPGIDDASAMATLNRFSAEVIVRTIGTLPGTPEIYTSGGGVHNPLLMRTIRERLSGHRMESTERLGIDPDAKEAVLFAVLANELVAGSPATFEGLIRGGPPVTMGKISLPE